MSLLRSGTPLACGIGPSSCLCGEDSEWQFCLWRRLSTLNIENLAEFFGWDGTLVSLAKYVPIQLQCVWAIIAAPTVLVTSIAVLAFAAGMRWDGFLKHQKSMQKSSPYDREKFAQWWEQIAHVIETVADLYATYFPISDGIDWDLGKLQDRTQRETGVVFKFRNETKSEALELSQFLMEAAVEIRQDDYGDLRKMIAEYNARTSPAKKPLASPSASETKLSAPPDQQDQ